MLQTSGEVIDALGGTAELAASLGRSMTVISNWRTAGSFPANTYLVLNGMLSKAGASAPAHLWKMVATSGRPAPSARAEELRA